MIARKRLLITLAVAGILVPAMVLLPPNTERPPEAHALMQGGDPCSACPDSCVFNPDGGWSCSGTGEATAVPPVTQPPAAATELPPLTREARATLGSLWATSSFATAGAQETAILEATQTMQSSVEEIVCYSCYETAACASGWAEVCFVRPKGTLSGIMYPYSNDCQAASECEPSSSPPKKECVPGEMSTEVGSFDRCDDMKWAYDLWVRAFIPPHIVQVRPFPRWFVGMGASLPHPYESGEPGTLTLQDYPALTNAEGACAPRWDSDGCWSKKIDIPDPEREDPLPGDRRDMRIGLRWRRIDIMPGPEDPTGAPAICWDWDEREWNIGENYGYGRIPAISCGKSVSHIYETASWGKPKNGPNFIPAEDVCASWTSTCKRDSLPSSEERRCHCCEQIPMSWDDWGLAAAAGYEYESGGGVGAWQNPAYQVKVPTYWAVEWAFEMDVYEVVSEDCECQHWPGWGTAACDLNGDGTKDSDTKKVCEKEYDWRHHFNGWNLIDLRNYGEGTWYRTSYSVRTTGSYAGCAFEYGDPNPGTSVRVPVIEIQSVIRDPCVLDGTCPDK
jgi:hypothetical protein